MTLSDVNPPESYIISGEGKGGAAGFAKGKAKVSLVEDGSATILSYEVDAEVGGKLAQVGGRLIEGTSKKLAGDFFETFSAIVDSTKPTLEKTCPGVSYFGTNVVVGGGSPHSLDPVS